MPTTFAPSQGCDRGRALPVRHLARCCHRLLTGSGKAVQTSIARMRGLISELHPDVLSEGLTAALGDHLGQVENDGELHCELRGGCAADPSGIVAMTHLSREPRP